MAPLVIDTSRDELERRRADALAAVGLEEAELARRVSEAVATLDEYDAWAEVDTARFLLENG